MGKMNESNFIFGERIRELRLERKMSLAQLGKELNMTRQNLSLFEIKSFPSLKTILMFADYYGVSVDYLLGRTENKYLNEDYCQDKLKNLREELNILEEKIRFITTNEISMKIRVKRAEKNLTIKQLSEMSGINAQNIRNIENNKSVPHKNTIERLLKALDEL